MSSTHAECPRSDTGPASYTGPWAQEALTLSLMLVWKRLEILNNFFNKGPALSLCTEL